MSMLRHCTETGKKYNDMAISERSERWNLKEVLIINCFHNVNVKTYKNYKIKKIQPQRNPDNRLFLQCQCQKYKNYDHLKKVLIINCFHNVNVETSVRRHCMALKFTPEWWHLIIFGDVWWKWWNSEGHLKVFYLIGTDFPVPELLCQRSVLDQ